MLNVPPEARTVNDAAGDTAVGPLAWLLVIALGAGACVVFGYGGGGKAARR